MQFLHDTGCGNRFTVATRNHSEPSKDNTMKTTIKSLLAAVCAFALSATVHALQPEMNEAIHNLEEAKHHERPIEHLEKAKHHLEEAAHNKHGERVAAIRQIDEAIAAHRAGDHRAMHEHIERAIHEVREGERDARRK